MKTLFKRIFIDNWPRKAISVLLSVIIWFLVNQSLVTSRTINNVPVRVINIPAGQTIVDLQGSGILTKRHTITLVGNKTVLDELTSNDLEIIIDAQNKKGEWIATISKRNLISLNPEIDLTKGISRVSSPSVIIRLTRLVTEKIPIFITQPVGEAPRDYQYLDVWPYQLNLNVSGPEEVVKRLKAKGIRLTFDLNDITKTDLDNIRALPNSAKGDAVSYFVPEQWKRVNIPLISDAPIEIDDPGAKELRIDFVRVSHLPIHSHIPVSLYFPTEGLATYNPKTVTWGTSPLLKKEHGLLIFGKPLYAKGVSQLFLGIVQNMIQLSVIVEPTKENQYLNWSVEFINPRLLEDRFVSVMMADISDTEVRDLQPLVREEYLRNRFRSYMNRFQLYLSDDKRLEMQIHLEDNKVIVQEGSLPLPNSAKFRKE